MDLNPYREALIHPYGGEESTPGATHGCCCIYETHQILRYIHLAKLGDAALSTTTLSSFLSHSL